MGTERPHALLMSGAIDISPAKLDLVMCPNLQQPKDACQLHRMRVLKEEDDLYLSDEITAFESGVFGGRRAHNRHNHHKRVAHIGRISFHCFRTKLKSSSCKRREAFAKIAYR
jgi:hypothetical protein